MAGWILVVSEDRIKAYRDKIPTPFLNRIMIGNKTFLYNTKTGETIDIPPEIPTVLLVIAYIDGLFESNPRRTIEYLRVAPRHYPGSYIVGAIKVAMLRGIEPEKFLENLNELLRNEAILLKKR